MDTPRGRAGRPSRSLTLEHATALLAAAERSRLHAYIALCLLTGIRSEEARALTWDHVNLDAGTVSVWRSARARGDTKTERSRRTLKLPAVVVQALREHRERQAAEQDNAGPLWQEHRLVLVTSVGTPLDSHNVRRDFRKVTKAAGLGERWVPKELRTSFLNLMSHRGVSVEEDRAPGGSQLQPHHRDQLPARAPPGDHDRRRDHGPDLRWLEPGPRVSARGRLPR